MSPRPRDALLLGAGLVILANARPFEGLLAALAAALLLLRWLIGRRGAALRAATLRVCVPTSAVLIAGALATGKYNQAVTGDPLTRPYDVHQKTYEIAGTFVWSEMNEDRIGTYRHRPLEQFHMWRYAQTIDHRYWRHLVARGFEKLNFSWDFYVGWLLVIPMLAGLWAFREDGVLFAWIVIAAVAGSLAFTRIVLIPHYIAPVVPLIFLCIVQGCRRVARFQALGRPLGRAYLAALPVMLVAATLSGAEWQQRASVDAWRFDRHRLERQLAADLQPDLVIVRYGPRHVFGREWVYNGADIDSQPVVWAREMDAERNRRLVEYFRDRRIWLLEVTDVAVPRIMPYTFEEPSLSTG